MGGLEQRFGPFVVSGTSESNVKRRRTVTDHELELQLDNLEDLVDEIVALVDDPDIPDGELRGQLRELLEVTGGDE